MPLTDEAPKDAPTYAPTSWGELRSYSDIPGQGGLTHQQTRHLIHGYYAATSYVDAQLGRVLESLDQLDLAENTIVVLWGDHGWHLGDHGMWCKHTNYEQSAHIPLIISSPSGVKDSASDALIETVDIYPTLAELAGIVAPTGLDGKSFANIVHEGTGTARPFCHPCLPAWRKVGGGHSRRSLSDGPLEIDWQAR